jgi:hypothetical protein
VASDVLGEFVGALEIARGDLERTIGDIVPEEFFEAEFNGANYEPGDLVTYAEEDIKQAFVDFDWLLARALRALKQKLAVGTGGAAS